MGITRLANVTGLDNVGLPVVMAVRPNSRSLAVAQGKGITLEAAKVSALMEAVETYHAERIMLPLRRASRSEISRVGATIDIDLLPRMQSSPLGREMPLLWIEGRDWVKQQPVQLPYQVVHTAYTTNMRYDLGTFLSCTTGLASGNHLLEAVSHAVCEIVERDATLLASLESDEAFETRRLNLASVDDPDCAFVLGRFAEAGVAVAVWETTRDIRIPSFQCRIIDRKPHLGRGVCVAGGAGCHPARHIALLRALTEAAQSRLTGIAGSRDDLTRQAFREIRNPANVDSLRRLIEQNGVRMFQSAPNLVADTFEVDVAWELERLTEAEVEQVVVVDLTKPEFGIPVVRVVIPGLETSLKAGDCVPGPRARRVIEVGR
jgi:ribosomal protein S12 methylthiotransferase accessory factor